jgi:hypothetical protein
MPANGGEAASLVESAMLLRWRAPELALLLADRAVSAAQDDKMAVLRADHLAVFALNRLGRHAEAVHRIFPAVRDADTPPELRYELHVELAHCAVALGEPTTALSAVRAVLVAGDDVAPVLRGAALVGAAEALVMLGRDDLVVAALDEADELYREDPSLDHDTALLLRAAARAVDAARHRQRGAAARAEAKAREGRELLVDLADPEHDSGEVSARLMLEIVLALLDRDAADTALQEVRALLRRPVRAAAAGSVGRLRLALATRVHLAEGRHESALTLLADAVEGAQRHGVDAVLAECLEGLSHVHEARGEFADALHCMRAARVAEARHHRNLEAARSVIRQNCWAARREEARWVAQVAALLGNAGTGGTGVDGDTASVSTGNGVSVGTHPSGRTAPAEAAHASAANGAGSNGAGSNGAGSNGAGSNGAGVQAGEATATAVDTVVLETSPVVTASAGPVEPPTSAHPGGERPQLSAQSPGVRQPAEGAGERPAWPSEARHRRGAETLVSVSDLLPASAFAAGRSGRRRAENRTEEPKAPREDPVAATSESQASHNTVGAMGPDIRPASGGASPPRVHHPPSEPATAPGTGPDPALAGGTEAFPLASPPQRDHPAPAPPPAPEPRALEWDSAREDAADETQTRQLGLGDLLAEALAAYQESRDLRAEAPAAGSDEDESAGPDGAANRQLHRYRGRGTRWSAGLAMNPSPTGGYDEDPAEALTNPLLRLPDLTAEPRWLPPEPGRRFAAGD